MEQKISQERPEVTLEKEWNNFVQGFVEAQLAWERMFGLLPKIRNVDKLDLTLQRLVDQVCRTTKFRYAATSFLELMGMSDNIGDLLIKPKKEIKK